MIFIDPIFSRSIDAEKMKCWPIAGARRSAAARLIHCRAMILRPNLWLAIVVALAVSEPLLANAFATEPPSRPGESATNLRDLQLTVYVRRALASDESLASL